jgi:hypothetical protein
MRNQAGRCLDVIGWTDAQYLAGSGLPQNGPRLQRSACTPGAAQPEVEPPGKACGT